MPRDCQLNLAYAGPSGPQHVFNAQRTTGGYCDRLMSGAILLEPDADRVRFETMKEDGSLLDRGMLRLQQ